ncbi:MAG TPA: PrsW family glutamic-type intramembrane protease [Candidatus Paceibacterota bacterium]
MEFSFIKHYPFILSFLLGLIPALLWLWFWLKEDRHPEPIKNLTLSFLGGMLAVLFVLPLQKIVYDYLSTQEALAFTLWASLEELLKFVLIYFIAIKRKVTDEPVDDIIYMIVGALGFVTLENTLFLLEPVKDGDVIKTIINSNLRFMGASLVHIMSSATIGVCMALAFYKNPLKKKEYTIFGIILAIILHTGFNLFIINQVDGNIFLIFGMVWIGIIVLLLLFEKVKNITNTT